MITRQELEAGGGIAEDLMLGAKKREEYLARKLEVVKLKAFGFTGELFSLMGADSKTLTPTQRRTQSE